MARTVVGFLGLLVLLSALQAEDKPETPTPTQRYKELALEYDKAFLQNNKAYKEAKTDEDRQKVLQERKSHGDKYASRFLELAEKNPKDPAAVDALMWIVLHIRPTEIDPRSPRSTAIQILLRDHLQVKRMVGLCSLLPSAYDQDSRHLLREVLEKSKYRPAQGHACFALAKQTENRLRLARKFKDDPLSAKRYEASFGKEIVEALVKADPNTLSKEAETLYERVVKDFAELTDVRGNKLSETAKDRLDALRHAILVVRGERAPEIEGEDIDGKQFKLSDYRGKVVLLDFWGHW